MTARVGDKGLGAGWKTIFVKGAKSVLSNGKPSAYVTTQGITTKGTKSIALDGSPDTLAEGKGMHRLGDQGIEAGKYIVVSGSSDVQVNDK